MVGWFGGKLSWHNRINIPAFAWRDWGKPGKYQSILPGVPAKIRTKHIPNTSLAHYRSTNLLGKSNVATRALSVLDVLDHEIHLNDIQKLWWIWGSHIAVVMKICLLCTAVKVNRKFGRTYRFHLQCWRLSQSRNRHEAGNKQRNVRRLSPDCTASHPRRLLCSWVRENALRPYY
jgi:hypothetical protein